MEDQEIKSLFLNPETERNGFEQLTRKYSQRVYWHVRKIVIDHDDADDVTQEAFLKVWTNRSKFRGDSGLFTWIYRIATNESLNFLNKKKRTIMGGELEVELASNLTADELVSGDKIQLMLQHAILSLPEKQRLVFNMKYFDDLTFKQIAEITDTSEGALKASYHHAVKKIEEFMKGN